MTKESAYELQKIDCNCNDCAFMTRDIDAFKRVVDEDKATQLMFFEWRKQRAIEAALFKKEKGHSGWVESLRMAEELTFTYMPQRIQQCYGKCTKFNKDVTFLPNTFQIETQQCFVHRKDINK